MAILRRKAELQGVEVPNDVVEYIAKNVRSNIREIEGALLSVVGPRARRGDADRPAARRGGAGAGAPPRPGPAVTIEQILERVAAHFQVKPSGPALEEAHAACVCLPRQVVMYLARKLTPLSLEEIGDALRRPRPLDGALRGSARSETECAANPRFAGRHPAGSRTGSAERR